MLHQLQKVLQCAFAEAQANPRGGVLHAAFEWPRAAYVAASELPELQAIQRLLPWKCQFDGCMYGLRAKSGILMQNPWTVYTTMPEIEAVLHKRCDRQHEHQVTRGTDAVASGRYTAEFVRCVGDAMLRGHARAPSGASDRATGEVQSLVQPLITDNTGEVGSGTRPSSSPALREPSPGERETHAATHTPYAEWCAECVRGRGRDAAHPRKKTAAERRR